MKVHGYYKVFLLSSEFVLPDWANHRRLGYPTWVVQVTDSFVRGVLFTSVGWILEAPAWLIRLNAASRDIGSLCVFYRLYHGECSKELHDAVLPSPFYHRSTSNSADKMASMAALAEQYFSTLNPLAEKIREDMDEARAAYETMWDSFTEREKVEIINESLIKPELTLKYTALDTLDFDINDPPFFRKSDLMSFFGREHGRRVVHDDGAEYRDEHSAPFIYHTKSQLNLCELSTSRYKEEDKGAAAPVMSELALSHSKVVSELKNALKSHDALRKKESPRHEEQPTSPSGFISKIMNKKLKGKGEESERLVSPERTAQIVPSENIFRSITSPKIVKSNSGVSEENRGLLSCVSRDSSGTEMHSCEDLASLSTDTLTDGAVPRTGYDFLDNW